MASAKRAWSCAALVCASCNGGSSTVPLTMHVLRGASGGPGADVAHVARPAASDGLWFLSPDQATVTVDSITFVGAANATDQSSATLTGCQPTYQRSAPDLTPIADCSLEAPVGSWSGVMVYINATASILIDDSANGLYTTASGITTTAPPSADFTPLTVPNGGGGSDFPIDVFFDEPIVIGDSGAAPDAGTVVTSLALLVDMNHTVFANVVSGNAAFNTSLPIPPASIIASPTGTGKATFYSPTGTVGNHDAGQATGDDTGSVRFFYPSADGQPGFAFVVTPGPGDAYPLDAAKSFVGGYLGRDSTGTICWANSAQNESWAHYSQFCSMQEVTDLGGTTTLSCQHADPAPAPASGDTYASGCPPITTPSFTEIVTLVAD